MDQTKEVNQYIKSIVRIAVLYNCIIIYMIIAKISANRCTIIQQQNLCNDEKIK